MSFNSFNGRINCCYKCEKRHIGCHNTCEDYLRERKALDEFNENQRKINQPDRLFNELKSDIIAKTKHKYKIK